MNILPINIAVIDDGINEELYQTGRLAHNLEITHDLIICDREGYDPFLPSHGTTCAAIIKKYSPEAVISSVKILNSESRTGMKAQLICALQWCVDNSIRIVNLSLGTIDYRDFLQVKEAVEYACEKNLIIVAACNNLNIFTCPASLEKVIGVKCDVTGILNEGEYIYNSDCMDGIDITACAKHKLKKYDVTEKVTSECNSYAAPMVTAHVYNLINNNPNMTTSKIKAELKKEAHNMEQNLNVQQFKEFKEPDIPVIVIYNNSTNDFAKGLNGRFRSDGYNALCVYEDIKDDICNGYINIKQFANHQLLSLKKSVYKICNIFSPDILLLTYDNHKTNNIQTSEIVDLDADVQIYVNVTSGIKVESSYETHIFNHEDNNQLEQVYSYILELFEKAEA